MHLSKWTAGLLAVAAIGGVHAADPVLSEGFDDVAALGGAGWVLVNESSTPANSWFQGNSDVFGAHSGAEDSYIAANYLSTADGVGSVSNWLFTPEISVAGGGTLSFYTRTEFVDGFSFSDTLEVLFSAGAGTSTSGSFSLLATVGPSYPTDWTLVTVALPTDAVSGRIAFHYTVADAIDANYIGIDSVDVTAVPEPATTALFALGAAGLLLRRRFAA